MQTNLFGMLAAAETARTAVDTDEIPVGARVAVKRSGSGGTVVAFDRDSYAAPMYIVELGSPDAGEPWPAGRAILRRDEIHAAHAVSWTCRCSACTEARKMLGRAMAGR